MRNGSASRRDAISVTVDFSLRTAQRSTLSPNRVRSFSYAPVEEDCRNSLSVEDDDILF